MSIYTEMLAAGLVIDNHYSDLYVKDTPEAWAIIEKYKDTMSTPKRFVSNITGEGRLVEIPFAYDPHWDKLSGTRSVSA